MCRCDGALEGRVLTVRGNTSHGVKPQPSGVAHVAKPSGPSRHSYFTGGAPWAEPASIMRIDGRPAFAAVRVAFGRVRTFPR